MSATLVFSLTPDDFTRQVECAATQWVKIKILGQQFSDSDG
jgi:hypothetical protein